MIEVKEVDISLLKKHSKNYREHPEDQISHLVESIKKNGVYRAIVIANDNTILAGHGVFLALKKLEYKTAPVFQLNISSESSQALKILIGDNEISHLAEINDRMLSEILKEIKGDDLDNLLGTGYDAQMLANLIFVTRPESEIKDINEAGEWAGLPEFDSGKVPFRLIISFDTQQDKNEFCANVLQVPILGKTKSIWWPIREKDDSSSIKIVG